MFEIFSGVVLEIALGIGIVAVGSLLFYFGNRLFGRKTGGKRLVIFAAGIALLLLGGFLLRLVFSKSESPALAAIFGAIGLLFGARLLFTAFASDESVEEAFQVILRS